MNIAKKAIMTMVVITFTLFNISPWLTEPAGVSQRVAEVQDSKITPLEAKVAQTEPEAPQNPEIVVEEEPTPEPTPTPVPEESNHQDEIYVLAQAMTGECFPDEYEDMVKVGMTLFNRVDSSDPFFPDDLISVIRQPDQVHGYNPHIVPEGLYLQAAEDVVNTYYAIKAGADLPWDYDILYWRAGTGADYGHNIFRAVY